MFRDFLKSSWIFKKVSKFQKVHEFLKNCAPEKIKYWKNFMSLKKKFTTLKKVQEFKEKVHEIEKNSCI